MRPTIPTLVLLTFAAGAARAADPTPPPAVTPPECRIVGTTPIERGTQLYDAPTGGHVIAVFTGVLVPATLSAIPLTDSPGALARAKLSTSDGNAPAFRLDGYVVPTQVPLYTTRDLPIAGPQVALATYQPVRFKGATADGLRVEHTILGSRQVLALTAPCNALALSPPGRPPVDDGSGARGYRMRDKVTTLDLFDAPSGRTAFTLDMQGGGTQLFWSREQRGGFVHVYGRSDIVIDAWVLARTLEAMHPGELMDPISPPPLVGAQVGIQTDRPPQVATHEIAIRALHEPEAPIVGTIEPGASFYLFTNIEGWANVWPTTVMMKPPEGGGFWVPEVDVMP